MLGRDERLGGGLKYVIAAGVRAGVRSQVECWPSFAKCCIFFLLQYFARFSIQI